MAIRNERLLGIILAYSACHRAQLLEHPLPKSRIAEWTKDLYPTIRHGMTEAGREDPSFNEHLAMTITLASLAIISPDSFAALIPWQCHLEKARKMLLKRKVTLTLLLDSQSDTDIELRFLSRWYHYLSTIGSLTQPAACLPLFNIDDLDLHQWIMGRPKALKTNIDCSYGCSMEVFCLIGSTADIMALLIPEDLYTRITSSSLSSSSRCLPCETTDCWTEIIQRALTISRLMHISCRLYGRRCSDPVITSHVNSIIMNIDKIAPGTITDASMLFGLFTAGCAAETNEQKHWFLDRFRNIEKLGMAQVRLGRLI